MVTSRRWIPDRGDLIWLTVTPQAGWEQADQLRNVDWKERRAKLIGRARPETVTQVLSRIAPLLGF